MELVPNGHKTRRLALATLYLLYAGVGGFQLLTDPSPAVAATLGEFSWAWSWMLVIGGASAAAGTVTKLWLLELCAQGLIATPFVFWCWFVYQIHPPTWLSTECLLLAIALGAFIRSGDLLYLATRSKS